MGVVPPHDSYFLANTQNFMSAVPVANTFALWYNKSKEFGGLLMTEVTRMRRLIVQNADLAMYEEKERLHAVRK